MVTEINDRMLGFKNIILIFFIFLFVNTVNAQSNVFEHYSVNDGLSQSVVKCIYQDKTGYLWFGTQNGLNKFDGYSFKKYINNPIDTNSISDNWVFSIAEDNSGNLLIATKKGVNIFNRNSKKFSQITYNQSSFEHLKKNEAVYDIFSTNEEAILINKAPYILGYNSKSKEIKVTDTKLEFDGAINDQKIPIIKDKNGFIWFGSTNGLSKINETTGFIETFEQNDSDNGISNNYITALFEDNAGNIWIGTRNGLNVYSYSKKKFYKYYRSSKDNSISHNFIRSIIQDRKGNIWVGTEGGGLNKASLKNNNLKEVSFTTFKNNSNDLNTISHDIVLSLYIDNSDILWIGTLQGIDKLDLKEKKFKLIRKTNDKSSVNLLDNVVASIYTDNNNELWVGNWGKGLNLINRKTRKVRQFSSTFKSKNYIPNDFVHVIFKDPNNKLWIGTRNGIAIFNEKQSKFVNFNETYKKIPSSNFSNNRINNIIKDKNNNIWIATHNGLHVINLSKKTSLSYFADSNSEQKISSNLIYRLIEDSRGNIWIATMDGLDKYNPKINKFSHYKRIVSDKNSLCDNFTISLCEDVEGNIWIGTQSGLNKFNLKDSSFVYYSEKDGLPDLVIYNIVKDNKNNLWLTTGNGLVQYNHKSKSIISYDMEDGLQSMEFNLNAIHKNNDGELFFGGMNGINYFSPDSIKNNKSIPPIVISNIEIINESGKHNIDIVKNRDLILKHSDYTLTIEFAALEFTNPKKNQYAYMIEGTNKDWINIGNRRFVSFTNLAEGKHILKIKGSNNDGVWNEKGVRIIIIKKPPWWRTNIAYIIYVVLLILSVFAFIKIRERSLIRERKILEHKVKIRTKEINTQKEEILAQNDEIQTQMEIVSEQRNKISEQNKSLTDSIVYAKRIQKAIFPNNSLLKELFLDYFTLFLPRDIVSGDFYWVKKVTVNSEPYIYFSVADCTGHGVPGGFVSMLGISLLNELIKDEKDNSPADILNMLREQIKISLDQTMDKEASKDGMDMSLCLYKPKSNELIFSAANSIIYHISENVLTEYKGNNMPVAVHYKEKPFTNGKIKLGSNDFIYLFSDGYPDQFGGENNKKFLRKNFRNLITSFKDIPFKKQEEHLQKVLFNWKKSSTQIDDITVMGIKLN